LIPKREIKVWENDDEKLTATLPFVDFSSYQHYFTHKSYKNKSKHNKIVPYEKVFKT
jgi:hypothetical protein